MLNLPMDWPTATFTPLDGVCLVLEIPQDALPNKEKKNEGQLNVEC
jgi:hypothetical protein